RAEDRAWVAQLRGKLRTEVYIDKIMYHYFWTSAGTSWQRPERIQPGPRLEVDHPHFTYYGEDREVPGIDLPASLDALAANLHVQSGMLKLHSDLARYAAIIEATKPEVIVETGTLTGASALWFASHGLDVITVDVDPQMPDWAQHDRITYVVGDSADPAVARYVRELVAGRRCMVSLDSDHSAAHVTREIELYGPLVSPGCYLVVEDGILGHAPPSLLAQHGMRGMVGSPLDAIAARLAGATGWTRDLDIEQANPVTHHVAGWWRRDG
ncbi:MAG TPA: CmcI family methyltransferase, partial [Micromonosporaceae bacterium]|nr:CmcI family methyltransferase [Micromonosporaceae bacterium]